METVLSRPSWDLTIPVITGILLGFGLLWKPFIAMGLFVLFFVLGFGMWIFNNLTNFFLVVLGLILIGYAFMGRGFAYFGIPPLYLGEIVLLLGMLAILWDRQLIFVLTSPTSALIIMFAIWGAICTIPYISIYGIHAFRDGVIWGYAAFALILSNSLISFGNLHRVTSLYGKLFPYFLLWVPLAGIMHGVARDLIPNVPGTTIPLIVPLQGSGDTAVHIAGTGAFLLLGLHWVETRVFMKFTSHWQWFVRIAWLIAFVAAGSLNRGGLLAILAGIGVVVLLYRNTEWGKLLAPAIIGTVIVFFLEVEIDMGKTRTIAPQQIAANLQSIVGIKSREGLDSTREWRLSWWGEIFDYTFGGNYFWMGKGFGVNLADDDGFQVSPDKQHPLRSPHNGHLTILARAGVPGFVLWIVLNCSFVASILLCYFRAIKKQHSWWAKFNVWMLSYWLAAMISIGFSTALESPQAGIWFWCIIGVGLAAIELQRREFMGLPKLIQQT